MTALATNFSAICTRVECDNPTWEGRTVAFLRIGTGTGGGRPRILIVAGVHPRELAPPDAVLTFIEKLLKAYDQNLPIVYDKFLDTRPKDHNVLYKRFTIPFSPDVRQIIERTELYVLPLANPDGRAFVQSANGFKMWRKNLRPAPAGLSCPPLPPLSAADRKFVTNDPRGVDLNRNFDVAWDFKTYYSASFFTAVTQPAPPATLGVSDDPCDIRQLFHGPAASPRVREPETQNIVDLITDKKINFYMDVHSDAGQILFPWGIAGNQETSPERSFKNTALDNPAVPGRDPTASIDPYAEWVPPGVIADHRRLGDLIRDKIQDSTGYTGTDEVSINQRTAKKAKEARTQSLYPAIQSISSFPKPDFEPGGSDDFAFSQQIGMNPGPPITATALDPVFAFTFECGRKEDGGFQPRAATEYPKIEREVGMALATFMFHAANLGAPVPSPPPGQSPSPPPSPSGTPSSGSSHCLARVATVGTSLQPVFQFVCELRDKEIRATELGRRAMNFAETLYYAFSPRVAQYLRRHRGARSVARLALVAPASFLVIGCAALLREVQPRERRVRWLLVSIAGVGMIALAAIFVPLFFLAEGLAAK